MESLDEFLQFLTPETRLDLKVLAVEQVLGKFSQYIYKFRNDAGLNLNSLCPINALILKNL